MMNKTHWLKKAAVIFVHALIGWGLCGAIIFIGRSVTTMQTTLIIHAFAVPIVFALLSLSYFRFFNYTSPLQTAAIFLSIAFLLDLFVIAPFAEKSFAMFTSPQSTLGTWMPFSLIFLSTYLVGWYVTRPKHIQAA
jgi:hypothetical protein